MKLAEGPYSRIDRLSEARPTTARQLWVTAPWSRRVPLCSVELGLRSQETPVVLSSSTCWAVAFVVRLQLCEYI